MAYKETYQEFVEKFKPKKTTDDCYTPPEVYDCVLQWLKEKVNLEGLEIKRPFYPGGDYKAETYTQNCVVVDNPPFSILAEIVAYYNSKGVKYFLFAPYLTCFHYLNKATIVITNSDIVYENGAKVNTSFVTNILGEIQVLADADLSRRLREINERLKANLPKYNYPDELVTASRLGALAKKGVSFTLMKNEGIRVTKLDNQISGRKIFGSGFLISELKAKELKAKELKAQELKVKGNDFTFILSEREKQIVKLLNKQK